MANRSKKRRRKKSKKRGAMGLIGLELIGVAAFAALLTTVQSQRDAAVDASQISKWPAQANQFAVENTRNQQSQAPRLTQVIGDIWEAGF